MSSLNDISENAENPKMFSMLRQLKNAIVGELKKLKPSSEPLQNDLPECNVLPSECDNDVQHRQRLSCEVTQIAECEICTDPLTAKAVYSCNTCFNLLCSYCMIKVRCCPFCRSPGIFADRNYPLERFLTTLNLPCKNQRYGCKKCVDRNTRELHEKQCEFSPFHCPHYPGCRWSGDAEQLKEHLSVYHFTRLVQRNRIKIKISRLWAKLKAAYGQKKTYSMIMYCHNLVFNCKITLFNDNIIITFLQVKTCNHQMEKIHFGVGIEVSSLYRTVRGIIPLPDAGKVQKISLSPKFFLSKDDLENDRIVISIDIMNLDSILSE